MARYATLRGMSLAVAGLLEQGETPLQEAALVKDLGVDLEQETPDILSDLLDVPASLPGDGGLEDALAFLTQTAPTFFAARRYARDHARHHRARAGPAMSEGEMIDLLVDQAERLFGDLIDRDRLAAAEAGDGSEPLAGAVEEFGFVAALAVSREDGGLGFADAGRLFTLLGSHAVPLPLGETMLAIAILARAGIEAPEGAIALHDDALRSAAFASQFGHVVMRAGGRCGARAKLRR